MQLRMHLEHEDHLVNQRLSWLLASQSFLFAGAALIITNIDLDDVNAYLSGLAVVLISVMGLMLCAIIRSAIEAAYDSIRVLRLIWRAHFEVPGSHESLAADLFHQEFADFRLTSRPMNGSGRPGRSLVNQAAAFVFGWDSDPHALGGVAPSFGRYPYLTGSGHPTSGRLGAIGARAVPGVLILGWLAILAIGLWVLLRLPAI